MDVATRYIFTTAQADFDEEQFPGLPPASKPDLVSNPNLSPYEAPNQSDRPGMASDRKTSPPPPAKKPGITKRKRAQSGVKTSGSTKQ